jgi:hypothetical protein
MDAHEFVANFKKEKEHCLKTYTSTDVKTAVSELIAQMELNNAQKEKMAEVLNALLIDVFYSTLLGLDGSSSIGDMQHTFKIYDEENNLISDCGEIEDAAWEAFHV